MDDHIAVPLRSGGKKMKKRRELDALISQNRSRYNSGSGGGGQDKTYLISTDEQEDDIITWAKASSHRGGCCLRRRFSRIMWPMLLMGSTIILFGFVFWLYFDMKQQFDDYRQKVEEISAASKTFPTTLQSLHESSTFLVRNQSSLLNKIDELQRNVDALHANFSEYRTSNDAQQNYVKYNKIVADFGAKIEATTMDIERIKEHYNNFVVDQKRTNELLSQLQSNFTQYRNQSFGAIKMPYNFTDEFNNFKVQAIDNFKSFEANLSLYNSSFNQKTDMMHEELMQHKTKLDEIFDRFENITSHVTSIETSWPEFRQNIITCKEHTSRLDDEIVKLRNKLMKLEHNLQNIYADAVNGMHFRNEVNMATTSTEQLWDKTPSNRGTAAAADNGASVDTNGGGDDKIADMLNATAVSANDMPNVNENNGKPITATFAASPITTTTTTTSPTIST